MVNAKVDKQFKIFQVLMTIIAVLGGVCLFLSYYYVSVNNYEASIIFLIYVVMFLIVLFLNLLLISLLFIVDGFKKHKKKILELENRIKKGD